MSWLSKGESTDKESEGDWSIYDRRSEKYSGKAAEGHSRSEGYWPSNPGWLKDVVKSENNGISKPVSGDNMRGSQPRGKLSYPVRV